ncbi:6-carboxytetrahydropterin synthase [Sphaerisporangium sp. NPDC051017]|uniref:6-pyruvoyl trahydropterin synthase family protein n=1 Tax=Sphaerisporangium sp. NPDC051017 TaxID=3154636 RepID=UPI00342D6262
MYAIRKQFKFEAAHHLNGLPDDHKCAKAHGHSYVVEIELSSPALDATGFVTDFANLAPIGGYIASTLDHTYLNELRAVDEHGQDAGPLFPQPSSEQLARHLYDIAVQLLPESISGLVTAVRIWETAFSSAVYLPGEAS